MATFKTISSADIKTTRTTLNQLVDFIEEDLSGSSTRKRYEVFVTSSGGKALTSSLFHTVYDQQHNLQTANEIMDLTYGVFSGSGHVSSASIGVDTNGKILFNVSSSMMREKINIYRQYSQTLLGDANIQFSAPFASSTSSDKIETALFLNFKRLFVRDGIKRESFAMRFYQSSSGPGNDNISQLTAVHPPSGAVIFTDVGSAAALERSQYGGDVGNLVLASDTSRTVGLLFYQQGIAILDLKKALDADQKLTGSIPTCISSADSVISASFVPHFVNSASIDTILDHIATSRFSSGSNTCITFQNNTQINSTLVFCRATADEFNYSSNPTFTNAAGRILVKDESEAGTQKSFSFVTTIGLYDANEELLATAKLSRPVEKNDEKDLTFRVRLDF